MFIAAKKTPCSGRITHRHYDGMPGAMLDANGFLFLVIGCKILAVVPMDALIEATASSNPDIRFASVEWAGKRYDLYAGGVEVWQNGELHTAVELAPFEVHTQAIINEVTGVGFTTTAAPVFALAA